MKRNLKFLALILGTLCFTSCSDWFESVVPLNANSVNSTDEESLLNKILGPKTQEKKLSKPVQLFVSQGMYAGRIDVSWSTVDHASFYEIERAVVEDRSSPVDYEGLDWDILEKFCYETKYSDVILENPGPLNDEYYFRYFYRVTAKNIIDKYDDSEVSDVNENQGCGWLLPSPLNTEATKGESSDYIKVSWDPVDNATGYSIYRTDKSNGTAMELLGTSLGNQNYYKNEIITAESGIEFYYKVIATTSYGTQSAFSTLAMGYSLVAGAPDRPEMVQLSNGRAAISRGSEGFVVTWPQSDLIDGLSEITYTVYRNSSEDSELRIVKSGLKQSETTITDKSGIKPNVYYYYYVVALGKSASTGNILKSPFSLSGKDDETPAEAFLLSYPQSIEIIDGSDDNHSCVRWQPPVGAEYEELFENYYYSIYVDDDKDGDFDNRIVEKCKPELSEDGYYSMNVQKYKYYKLTTVCTLNAEIESSKSGVYAPYPAAPKNVNASKTKNLSAFISDWDSSANSNGVYPVMVTWEKPDTDDPSGYYVYRSTSPSKGWKKLNDEPVSELSYVDYFSKSKPGVFYYYKVVSLNNLFQGNKGNNPELDDPEHGGHRESWGYGALTREQWFREYNKEISTSQNKLVLMHKAKDTDKLGSETIYAYLPVNKNPGTLKYSANIAGLGADITMPYSDYADHTIISDGKLIGSYFILNGNTDTTSDMNGNGHMLKTVHCYHYDDLVIMPTTSYTFKDTNGKNNGDKTYTGEVYDYVGKTSYKAGPNGLHLFQGMYPGSANYDNLQIKGGAAGGGYYIVTTYELDHNTSSSGTVILPAGKVDWLVGEEIR